MLANLAVWLLLLQDDAGASWSLMGMWHSMQWVARSVIILLFLLSVWAFRRND